MAQFDVFRTRGEAARLAPYLITLQSDFLTELSTVLVAPVRTAVQHGPLLRRVQVAVEFLGEPCVVSPEQMAAVPRSTLGARAGSLSVARQELMAAIDFLFLGF